MSNRWQALKSIPLVRVPKAGNFDKGSFMVEDEEVCHSGLICCGEVLVRRGMSRRSGIRV